MHSSKQFILVIHHFKHSLFGMGLALLFFGGMYFDRTCKSSAGGCHFPRLTMQVGDTIANEKRIWRIVKTCQIL